MMILSRFAKFARILLVVGLAGCGKPARMEIKESRPRRASDAKALLDASYEQAFPVPEGFRWKTPPGWTREEPTQFRLLNFSFGKDGECYLSELPNMADPGDHAAVAAADLENGNRWCRQMEAAPFTAEQWEQLPAKPFLGGQAKFIDLKGTYTGAGPMGGGASAPKANQRLLGLILTQGGTTYTLKLTGSAELVEAEAKNFELLSASLRVTGGATP